MPKFWISVYILKMALREAMFPVDASTNELNPLVCITFILTAYHACNDTEDG